MHDLEILIENETINSRVRELAHLISDYYKNEEISVICILKGSFMFMSDLVKEISADMSIDFATVQSYDGKERKELSSIDLSHIDIKNRNILIVEDIVDSGNTINYIIDSIAEYRPKDIRIVSFLFKPDVYKFKNKIDWIGFKIEDHFVVGYGLDYNQQYRSLNSLYRIRED